MSPGAGHSARNSRRNAMRCRKSHGRDCMHRRGFLLGASAAVGATLAGTDLIALASRPAESADGMPGRFPGRVVEVHHPGAVRDDFGITHDAVRKMVARGMCDLTGAEQAAEAWRSFFQKDDVVGIKVNPVGRRYNLGKAQAISSHELVIEVVEGLKSAGVPAKNIILFERYADQFRDVYDKLM